MLKNTTEEYLVCLWKSRLTGANALLILQQKKTFYFIAIKALDKKWKQQNICVNKKHTIWYSIQSYVTQVKTWRVIQVSNSTADIIKIQSNQPAG